MAPPNSLRTIKFGQNGPEIPAIGFGLMGLSLAYGPAPREEERLAILDRAWELGCTNWDTADAYSDNEDLIGKWFSLHPERRQDIFLASKFALRGALEKDENGEPKYVFSIDATPEYCIQACEKTLGKLGVQYLDLYYMHRTDGKTPIEETMGAMAELVKQGKIKAVGLSGITCQTLVRAHAVHPVSAIQVEYNPWSLDIELPSPSGGPSILEACRERNVTIFAYSPLARGILSGTVQAVEGEAGLGDTDFRRSVPRYFPENFEKNLGVVRKMEQIAERKGCTSAQVTLAWLMAQGKNGVNVVPIPGTRKIKYLEQNVGSLGVEVTEEEEREVRKLAEEVVGSRESVGTPGLDKLGDTPELEV